MAQGKQLINRLLPTVLGLCLTSYASAEAPESNPAVDDQIPVAQPETAADQPATHEVSAANEVKVTPEIVKQQLAELINQQQYEQAYQLAEENLELLEGDSQFDFNYGFSAAQSNRFNQALFVFERLSNDYPDVPRYRLELARSYYFLGQLDAAEREFQQVLSSNPPNKVQSTIQKFLKRIEEQRQALSASWSALASYSGGYDSNINSSTDIEEIDIILGGTERRVRLNDNQKETSSGFYKLRGHVSYRAPLTKRSGFDIRIGGQRKANAKTDDYDLNSVFIDGGLQLIRGFHRWRAGGSYQQYWLADDSLQNTLAANLSWNYRLTADWRLNSKAEVRNNDNQINDDLDAIQIEVSAGPEYASGSFSAQSALVISTDSADNSPLAKDIVGLNLSGQYSLSGQSALFAMMAWRQYDFQKKNSEDLLSKGKQRNETLTQLILGYNQQIIPTLSGFAQFSYMDNQSNIDVYKYDRLLLEGGLTLAF